VVSFSAWFNTTTGGVILGQTDASTTPGGAVPAGWVPAVYVGTDGRVYASLFWHGPGPQLASAGAYNDGAWHQVTDVYGNGVETLYLDGNAVAAQAVSAVSYASAYRYSLGAGYTTNWANTTGGWSFFSGRLDEAAVYQGGLTGQQVAALYLSGAMPRVPVTVTVQNTPPTASLQGPADGVRGQARTFTFAATSASAAEQATGFTYAINWGDGSPVQTVARTPGNAAGVTVSHVFADSGTYPVTVTATDKDGHTSAPASQSITVTPWEIQTQPDPVHAGKTIQVLVVGGSTGADDISIDLGPHRRGIEVDIKEKSLHKFLEQVFTAPVDRIVVYGQAGNDLIVVSDRLKQTSELYGGDGNDTLAGGGGENILVGGDGNDLLIGGRGRNLMIGGAGKDVLFGGGRGDILIGGTTAYDSNETALRALLAEWASADSYKTRVEHLFGTLGGGLNGSYHLNADTVHDDGARDVLWGGDGRDWFLVSPKDKVKDRRHNETVTHV
jgi:Ca2+-binding RTX toxin-like protein